MVAGSPAEAAWACVPSPEVQNIPVILSATHFLAHASHLLAATCLPPARTPALPNLEDAGPAELAHKLGLPSWVMGAVRLEALAVRGCGEVVEAAAPPPSRRKGLLVTHQGVQDLRHGALALWLTFVACRRTA